MSDSVKLNIISGFDRTGVEQAQRGMNDVAGSMKRVNASAAAAGKGSADALGGMTSKAKQGAGAVTQLAGALGQGTGGAATAAKVASGALTGFASGGWIGLITAGVTAIIFHFMNMKAAAEKAAAAMKSAFQEGLEKAKQRQIADLADEYKKLTDQIDNAASKLDKLSAAQAAYQKSAGGTQSAESRQMQTNVEAQYQRKIDNAATPEEKALLTAQKNIELAEIANAEKLRAAQADINAAETAYKTEAQRANLAKDRVSLAKEQLELAKQDAAQIPKGAAWDKTREAAQKNIEAAQEDLRKANEEVTIETIKVATAQQDLETATINESTALTEAAIKDNEVIDAMDNLKEGIVKRARLQDQIKKAEEGLKSATEKAEQAIRRAAARDQERDKSVAQGARGLHEQRQQQRAEASAREKANEKEARWAENAERAVKAGVGLSARDRQRLADFRDFQQLRQRGGREEFDVAKNARAQLSALEKTLKETEKLNRNLEENLKLR